MLCAKLPLTYLSQIFVQCDSDLMLARRIRRDTKERGRTVDGILDQLVLLTVLIIRHHAELSVTDIFVL